MTTHQHPLPQMFDSLFLTDGGLETTLIFHDGMDLPCFASFDLLKDAAGTARLREYYQQYIDLALEYGLGFVLESATWRGSSDWGEQLGYSAAALARVNQRAVALLHAAADYHLPQIRSLVDAGVDLVTALTLPDTQETIGMVQAAQSADIPAVISFTVGTDGHLPSGQSLRSAIDAVDEATNNGPAYYMINCAHPTHFEHVLTDNEPWLGRIRGIRANASCKSHAELDESDRLTTATRKSWAGSIVLCRTCYQISPLWAAAAARITGISMR
jgi:S-methylmethionine-dependent homocysteine/selenocysteine methylase